MIIYGEFGQKIELDEIRPSSRKYPYIDFRVEREAGNDILFVENLTKPGMFENVSFTVNKGDKIVFVSQVDEEGEYVMKADENEQLKKQYISTGKSLWGSYVEIKAGVTMDDRLAFPYGKTVREGAPVVDGDYFE